MSMNKINVILLIYLLKPSLILMLNNKYNSLKFNEYFVDTCCSLNENERIYLSCGPNEKIHLNLIEIFYNSDEYCSSELYCCKYRTKCSRRITKYSSSQCDEKNSCWIDKTCLKIYDPCSNIYGLYGQYITINYSCLSSNINKTTNIDDYQPVPFIVKLLTSEETTKKSLFIKKKDFVIKNDFKSSPIFFISILFIFILLMLIIYWLANIIGNKICRKKTFQTNKISTKIFLEHKQDNKTQVQSLPIKHIYSSSLSSQPIYRYNDHIHYTTKYPYSLNPYQKYIHIQHNPTTGQFYSRTFNPRYHYYSN